MKTLTALERVSLAMLGLVFPLAFYPGAEDAYRAVQLFALALIVPGLTALRIAAAGRPRLNAVSVMVPLFFLWRLGSHFWSGPADWPWVAEQILYLALFFWAAARMGHVGLRRRAVIWILAGLGLAAIYSVLQSMGLDPLSKLGGDPGFGSRGFASLGNPGFWAGYLVLLLPLVLIPWLEGDGKQSLFDWKLGLFCLLLLLSLLLSQTRGAWVGLAVAMAATLWMRRGRWQPKRLVLAGGLGLAALLAWSMPGPHNPQGMESLKRLRSVFSIQHEGASGRFFMSRVAWEVVKDDPATGVGAGRFQNAFLVKQGELMNEEKYASQPYRYTADAHMDWLQLAAESGLATPLFLLWILWIACRRLWREGGTLRASLAAGLIAMSVHACFYFPLEVVPSAAMFWFVLGWSASGPWHHQGPWRVSSLRVTAALLVLVPAWLTLPPLLSSAMLNAGMNRSLAGKTEDAEPLLRKAALMTDDSRAWMRLGIDAEKDGRYEEASAWFENAVQSEPASGDAWNNLCLAKGKAGKLDEAEKACLRAIELNPSNTRAYGNLGNIRYLSKQVASARQVYEAGLARDPQWADGWYGLAVMAMSTNDTETARMALVKCAEIDPQHEGIRTVLEILNGKGR